MVSVLVKWIAQRIQKNMNAIIVINGDTGSGKTYQALRLASDVSKYLDTNFNVHDNVAFTFKDLLPKFKLEQNNKPGTPFVFEEVGAFGGGASARQWQSKANSLFNSFLQIDRHNNRVFIMTCPDFSMLDAASRKLCHMQMTMMKGIDRHKNVSQSKPKEIQINRTTGKVYYKYIRYNLDGMRARYKKHASGLPPPIILTEYEKEKKIFTDNFEKETMERLNGDEKKVKKNKKQTNTYEKSKVLIENGMSTVMIADMLNISPRTVRRHKSKWKEENRSSFPGIADKTPKELAF